MNNLLHICIALSVGTLIGVIIGCIKSVVNTRTPSQEKIAFMKKLVNRFAFVEFIRRKE